MSRPNAMLPLFPDAYMADCWHLSDAEHGRYLLLLMLMWQTPGCRIPNDDEWIARKLRRTVEDIQRDFRPIIKEFCKSDGNYLSQKRLRKEFKYVKRITKKRTVAAKSRWEKEKTPPKTGAKRQSRINPASALHENSNAPHPTPPHPIIKDSSSLGANGAAKPRQGKRLADDWEPTVDDVKIGLNLDFSEKEITDQFNRFRDYYRAKTGRNASSLNWSLNFRNWLRKAHDDRQSRRA